jgi:hypothetical protein
MTCPLCQENNPLDFHHWQYTPVSRGTKICRACHNFIHNGKWGRGQDSDNQYTLSRQEQELKAQSWADAGGVSFEGWRDLAYANLIYAHYDVNEQWPESVGNISQSTLIANRYDIPEQYHPRFKTMIDFVVRYYLLRRTNLEHEVATIKAANNS